MSKTNPFGVRFKRELFEKLKKEGLADSPQKVLNYLENYYEFKVSPEELVQKENTNTKHPLWKEGDPEEHSWPFFRKYDCKTYEQLAEKLKNQ